MISTGREWLHRVDRGHSRRGFYTRRSICATPAASLPAARRRLPLRLSADTRPSRRRNQGEWLAPRLTLEWSTRLTAAILQYA
jgi:hypothetical protein